MAPSPRRRCLLGSGWHQFCFGTDYCATASNTANCALSNGSGFHWCGACLFMSAFYDVRHVWTLAVNKCTHTHTHHNCKHVTPIKHVTSVEGQSGSLIGRDASAINKAQCCSPEVLRHQTRMLTDWLSDWLTSSSDVRLTWRNLRFLFYSCLNAREQAPPIVSICQSKRRHIWIFLILRTRLPP